MLPALLAIAEKLHLVIRHIETKPLLDFLFQILQQILLKLDYLIAFSADQMMMVMY